MKIDYWIQIWSTVITALVSIVSVFAANRLGRKDYLNKLDIQHKSERYHQLYLPLLQLLIHTSPSGLSYSGFQTARSSIARVTQDENSKNLDPLVTTIIENTRFASSELMEMCLAYSSISELDFTLAEMLHDSRTSSTNKQFLNQYIREAFKKKPKAEQLFYSLVKQILLEAQSLATETMEEDITAPLLKALNRDSPVSPKHTTTHQEAQ